MGHLKNDFDLQNRVKETYSNSFAETLSTLFHIFHDKQKSVIFTSPSAVIRTTTKKDLLQFLSFACSVFCQNALEDSSKDLL